MKALIFDCDGVLVDTERDGHRVAFNRVFARRGWSCSWNVALYKKLLKIAGGKERLRHYFDDVGWPEGIADKDALIRELHVSKTELFMQIIESGELSLRPGVARIVDEAIAAGIQLAVCSTSNEKSVNLIVEKLLGLERKARFNAILAGDVVTRKKPDPAIYLLVLQCLGLAPEDCVVVEDSLNGFQAARAAGMHCVVTTNGYTEDDDFTGAELVVPELGDPPNVRVTLKDLTYLTDRTD